MRKHVKGNVSWVGYIDWELESFHGDDYSIVNGSSQNASDASWILDRKHWSWSRGSSPHITGSSSRLTVSLVRIPFSNRHTD